MARIAVLVSNCTNRELCSDPVIKYAGEPEVQISAKETLLHVKVFHELF
jgi:hypothetical protein